MSRLALTPASERALKHAVQWQTPLSNHEVDSLSLLLGLLFEPECRAATMLSQHNVTQISVLDSWSELNRIEEDVTEENVIEENVAKVPTDFSTAVSEALQQARERCEPLMHPLELSTEHLLLGLMTLDDPVTKWLIQQGITYQGIEQEIHQLHQYKAEPLDFEPIEDSLSDVVAKEPFDSSSQSTTLQTSQETSAKISSNKLETDTPIQSGSSISSPQFTSNSHRGGVLRLLDASANRAREACRVLEDYVRFILNDSFLTAQLKEQRHSLESSIAQIPLKERLQCRETQQDVGTQITATNEYLRKDVEDVLAANFHRLEESLRSLEEYSKLVDANLAASFEATRYRTYTLHRVVDRAMHSKATFENVKLYVLVNGRENEGEFVAFCKLLITSGVDVIQLRDKQLDDRTLLQRARLLQQLTSETDTLFIMNDRPDLAVLSRADGVHLGQEELSVKEARDILGPRGMIGISTHTLEQAKQAVMDGADYIGMGPTFPSNTKSFADFPGLQLIQSISQEISLPAFAIGGINLENCHQVLSSGAKRIAVSHAISGASNPSEVIQQLKQQLNQI